MDNADSDAAAIVHDGDAVDEDLQTPWQVATDWGAVVLNVTAQSTPAPAPHETMVMMIVIVWTVIVGIVGLANLTASTSELVVGICVNINLFFFYGAPLSSFITVCRDRNSASIHIWTMITNTLNSCFWTAYGLAIGDPFIYVPNGIGAGLGFVQAALVLLFPRNVPDGPLKRSVGMSEKSTPGESEIDQMKDANPSSAIATESLGVEDNTNHV